MYVSKGRGGMYCTLYFELGKGKERDRGRVAGDQCGKILLPPSFFAQHSSRTVYEVGKKYGAPFGLGTRLVLPHCCTKCNRHFFQKRKPFEGQNSCLSTYRSTQAIVATKHFEKNGSFRLVGRGLSSGDAENQAS